MLKVNKKTIRRLGTVVMALAMAISVMAIDAFAAELAVVDFAKEYTLGMGATTAPTEALELVQQTKAARDYSDAKYATESSIPDVTVTKAADSDKFVVTAADLYSGVGVFTYTFLEKDAGTAGVTYADNTITLNVVRTWTDSVNSTIKEEYTFGILNGDKTAKIQSITNKFDAGTLTISKELTGNMADPADTFPVTVTFTSSEPVLSPIYKDGTEVSLEWTESDGVHTASSSFNIKAGTDVVFTNIPVGVTYTTTETDPGEYELVSTEYSDTDMTITAGDTDTVTITNDKSVGTPTGVIMNVAPYVLMVALAGGIAFFFLRRKHAE